MSAPNGCKLASEFGLSLKSRRSPSEGEFLFVIDPEPVEECVTALGGLPLFLRALRSLDVPRQCEAASAPEAASGFWTKRPGWRVS
jgi:hypothetical protein